MKADSIFPVVRLALIGSLLVAAAAGQDWPAKRNRDFRPDAAASSFNSFVTTGVIVKIKSAAIAKDGTITTQYTLTDSNGVGLDVNGVLTPGVVSMGIVAAFIPNGQSQYTAYTTTTDKATTNSNPSQIQAGMDSGGVTTLVDAPSGTYNYTFATKAPTTFDPTATHSIGIQAERDLSAYGYATMFTANNVFSFVPNGSAVTNVRNIINEASCNNCHDPISAHGSPGPRTMIAMCVLCHTPQSTNPDTLNTVDMKVFIHKIHMGSSLPSVVAGGKYQIVHRGTVEDYSTVVFPQDIRNCTTCHAAGPSQASAWTTNPTRATCGSCHDDVNFATGANHANLVQVDDTQCTNCHTASMHTEFDASIPGAHVVPSNSAALPGIVLKIQKVVNTTAGQAPTVTFQALTKAGNPIDITKLTTIKVVLGGNNIDYNTGAAGMRVSETPTTATGGANGVYTYTMTNKVPVGATGSYTVSMEAVNTVTLMAGTTQQTTATDMAVPVESYFSVDSTPMVARRVVVGTATCSNCHSNLGFVHGGSRGNSQECAICHNPALTDGTSKQSVDMSVQIHSIHRGSALANPYTLGTTNYQSVLFPGDLRNCNTCHVGSSYQVNNVGAVASVASPGGFTATTPPISAACQGCHDDKATASHALANTTVLGESCLACHGTGAQFAVDTVHARQVQH